MRSIHSKELIKHSLHVDDPDLPEVLDDLKGSFAVEYVLEALLAKGNTHTLYSALELIRAAREKHHGS